MCLYLGLKGTLQRAEGSGRGDDGGKTRHGWRVGVEELKKKGGRGVLRMVQSVSKMQDNIFMRQWRWSKQVILTRESQQSD